MFSIAVPGIQLVASQQNPTIDRTLNVEPSYLVYVDNVALPSNGATNFNITFQVFSQSNLFSVVAYGPGNQTLSTAITYTTSNVSWSNMTVTVSTGGATSFTLYTVLDGLIYNLGGNYSALVNFYPTVDTPCSATTTVYMPPGSHLFSYTDTSINNSTSSTGTTLSGSKDLVPTNSSLGTLLYSGNFQLLEVESLDRLMEVTPSAILVQDTLTFLNIDSIYGDTRLSAINLTLPENASGISAEDSIGALPSTQSNQSVAVTLRNTLYPDAYVQFTLVYSLPVSSIISSSNGRTIVSSEVLPTWLNMPVRAASVTILMPSGSSDPQMSGAQFTTNSYHLTAVANYALLTPFTNQQFTLSYVASSIGPYTGQILIIAIIAVIVIAYVIYRLKWAKKTPSPAKTPPPATAAKKPTPK
jgi:hypothetical protein